MSGFKFPQRFGSSFVLLNHLGRGGMGTVCLAIRGLQGLETMCVIKRLVPELLDRQNYVERFFGEANIARRLVQANLVQTYDVGKLGEELFLAQEYVHGADVSQLMGACWEQHRPLPVGLAVHIVREVARGLTYVHEFEGLGIVHRDVSPPNIRLAFAGEVKLLDFGVAKTTERSGLTAPQESMGKAFYMAPEQLFHEPVDRRADIYALGLVSWELLTLRHAGTRMVDGKVAPPGESHVQMRERLHRSDYQAPSLFNPEVPAGLDEVVLRCLARDPSKRFQTASDLADALAPFLPPGDPSKLLREFLGKAFNVEAETALLKRLVDEGRPLLPVSDGVPVAMDPPPSAPESEPAAPRKRWPVYAVGAVTLAVVVFVVIEIAQMIIAARPVAVTRLPASPPASAPTAAVLPAAIPTSEPVAAPETRAVTPTAPTAPAPHDRDTARKPAAPKGAGNAKAAAALLEAANEAYISGDFLEAKQLIDKAVAAGAGPAAHALRKRIYDRLESDRNTATSATP